ncbi:uncharacterized protein L969DRAFT_55094 [Mixia osmundae IAM 14324]|uniref:Integrase zinc-binding domain-containing protein n=1 Tax=Mixia osmundae (strain CBS 9802 / IAM 14324 / JCM 22182 / KY 12970) TaxID=764103 RepID=G7DV40_MIXOS|nr:uncharacterized protein L969DRAFT_55094 [Mixia osmundae IAM 14324]KEI36333.1 hypothetical protein L969DRAFT_55094 [Mixia osmundae IAM 14324]GAA94450.1 hypothetical protein E5Q_01102 [Mixia osmundae IAM 14324]
MFLPGGMAAMQPREDYPVREMFQRPTGLRATRIRSYADLYAASDTSGSDGESPAPPSRRRNTLGASTSRTRNNNISPTDESPGVTDRRAFEAEILEHINRSRNRTRERHLVTRQDHLAIVDILQSKARGRSDSLAKTDDPKFAQRAQQGYYLRQTEHGDELMERKTLLPVAVREDIYDHILLAHREVGHGGRDKTARSVRNKYAMVPKELVRIFVELCPTCNHHRRPGHIISGPVASHRTPPTKRPRSESSRTSSTQAATLRRLSLAESSSAGTTTSSVTRLESLPQQPAEYESSTSSSPSPERDHVSLSAQYGQAFTAYVPCQQRANAPWASSQWAFDPFANQHAASLPTMLDHTPDLTQYAESLAEHEAFDLANVPLPI